MASDPRSQATSEVGEPYSCADWLLQMKLAEKRNERWESRCRKIIKRYRNEHYDQDNERSANTKQGMNVLWSNVETLSPSVYGREPVPIAERRFLDRDVIGRVGAQVLERAMRYEMSDCGFHDAAQQGVKDYLLVGRAVAWLRFKPVIGQSTSLTDRGDDEVTGGPETNGDHDGKQENEAFLTEGQTDETPQEKLLSAGIEVDYVHWSDFLTSKARFWKEVEWVARKLYMSRDDLVTSFGEEIGDDVPLEMSPENDELKATGARIDQTAESMKKAIVYEIWHKPTRKVYTIAKSYHKFLEDPRDDPLNLDGFWPVPKPLFATMTNDTLEPVPDYLEYQDQALQIDEITNRMTLLTKALKVAGVYDASNKNLARLLDEGNENKLIPVQNWTQLSEKGGLDKAISFVPIKEIADVLMGLTEARDKIKQDMFEITGLADVIRGQADPRETAESVKTKGRWGSLRLQARQMAVARWCRDIIAMMGEIIAEHYPPELLINVSGAMYDEGIGGPAPEPPPKPDAGASAPPMLGHNGGPPMGQPVPPSANFRMGGPAVQGGGQPLAVQTQPTPSAVAGPGPQAGMGGQSSPGFGGNISGGNMAPAGPIAPPPPTPEQQYAFDMEQYAKAKARYQQEKLGLILQAIGLLKQDKMRGFRIDIETDSTVQNDANDEKSSRIEFIEAVTKFIEQGAQLGMQQPDAVPMLGKMLLFGVRGFRAGRDLESTIEEFVDKMEKDAAQAKNSPKPPSPEVQKEQIQLEAVKAKAAAETQKAQIDAEASAQDNQRAIQQKEMDAQIEQQRAALEVEKMRQELEFKKAEFEMRMREMEAKMALTAHEHTSKMELAEREHHHKREQMEASHANALAMVKAKPKKAEKAA